MICRRLGCSLHRHKFLRSGTADTTLPVDHSDPPDLTNMLLQGKKRIVGHGSFGTVYHCSGTLRGEVSMCTLTSLNVLPMLPVFRSQSRLSASLLALTQPKGMCSYERVDDNVPPHVLLTSGVAVESETRAWNMEKIRPSEHCSPPGNGERRRLWL